MSQSSQRPIYFAETNHRNRRVPFGIRNEDRRFHMLVIGKTGTGKSSMIRTMISQDIERGHGCALLDPHGDLATEVRQIVPPDRVTDLVYLDTTDPNLKWRFNPLQFSRGTNRALTVAGLVEVFKKLWPDEWGPRLEHLFRNVLFTLLEIEGATLAAIPALLADRGYRSAVVARLSDPVIQDFWTQEYDRYSPAFRAVVTAPLQNKLGALLSDPLLHRILTEPGEQIDLERTMDDGKVLLVNLDKGHIGEGPSALLGSLLLSHIALAGLHRSRQPENERRDFFVFCDEYQTFTTLSLATMLSELRKYRVCLTLANQHLAQLDPAIRDAVFGNVGSLVCFRVGAQDASYLARELAPVFAVEDLVQLPRFQCCVRLMIDGHSSRPFSASSTSTGSETNNP